MEVLCNIIHSMTSGFWERPLRHWKKNFYHQSFSERDFFKSDMEAILDYRKSFVNGICQKLLVVLSHLLQDLLLAAK